MMLLMRSVFVFSLLIGMYGCGDHKSEKSSDADRGRDEEQKPEEKKDKKKDDRKPDNACNPILKSDEVVLSQKKVFLARITWLDAIEARKLLRAQVTFTDTGRCAPTSAAILAFHPEMPSHGHGTDESRQKITPIAGETPQSFAIEGVKFSMGGPWVISTSATVNGNEDVVQFHVDVP